MNRALIILAALFCLATGGASAAYNPGSFVAPAPSQVAYPTLPYVTPEMYGAVGNGATDDHVGLNAATAYACANHVILFLDKSYNIGSTTWNMTSAVGCNSGITVQGVGPTESVITYHTGTDNTGIAWDLTGAAYVTASNFNVQGGTASGSNSPLATVLMGAAYNGGFLFSGIMTFTNVYFVNYQGSYTIYNAGAEQIHFINCTNGALSASVSPFVFVSSGSTPLVTSSLVTTNSPVGSMTQVGWSGEAATIQYYGGSAVNFYFTPAACVSSGCGIAQIYIDGFVGVNTASGASTFMVDNAGGQADSVLKDIGSNRLTMENHAANGNIAVANFSAGVVEGLVFNGHGASATTITQYPFVFNTGVINSTINWDPNGAGGWSGSYVAYIASGKVASGLTVTAPEPIATLTNQGTPQTSSGAFVLATVGLGINGSVSGAVNLQAPAGDGQCNAFSRVSGSTSGAWNCLGSNAAVTTSPVKIAVLLQPAQTCAVVGHDGGLTNAFADLVFVAAGGVGSVTVLASGTTTGTPAGRTYAFGISALYLTMGSGTYTVVSTCYGGVSP